MGAFRNQGPPITLGAFTAMICFMVCCALQAFDCEFAADHGDNDTARLCLEAAIDDQEITGEDTGTDHGVTFNPDDKGGSGAVDQMRVEIECAFDKVLGR